MMAALGGGDKLIGSGFFDRNGLPADTERRLEDWACWSRRRACTSHGRCASAEGMYSSGGGETVEVTVDLLEVLAVERVVSLMLPVRYRDIVRRHFVQKQSPKVIARAVGISEKTFKPELRWAVLMVRNCLTRSDHLH